MGMLIYENKYNITMIDVLGGMFVKNKITFSGTTDFLLPYNIIKNTFKLSIIHP